jgi:hypothetical protein
MAVCPQSAESYGFLVNSGIKIHGNFAYQQYRSRTMKIVDDHIEVSSEEASGGVTNHGVRYVLLASLLLAIALLSLAWMTGALLN